MLRVTRSLDSEHILKVHHQMFLEIAVVSNKIFTSSVDVTSLCLTSYLWSFNSLFNFSIVHLKQIKSWLVHWAAYIKWDSVELPPSEEIVMCLLKVVIEFTWVMLLNIEWFFSFYECFLLYNDPKHRRFLFFWRVDYHYSWLYFISVYKFETTWKRLIYCRYIAELRQTQYHFFS